MWHCVPPGAIVAEAATRVLARREARRDEHLHLLRLGWPVVSVTIVTPGADKDDHVARSVADWAVATVAEMLADRGWPVLEGRPVEGPAGPEWLAAVRAPAEALKSALTRIEDASPLGRLCDLDVVTGPDASGQPQVLSRREQGRPPRRCLVCDLDAAACTRSARHHPLLVGAARAGLAACGERPDADRAAALAVDALLLEARLTPKPGLVDAVSSGAHSDMDLALLERSAESLRPWFAACWWWGWAARSVGELREALVPLGVAGEAAMLTATGGVNTHKGALFALGLLVGALGAVHHERGVAHEQSARASGSAATPAAPGVEGAPVLSGRLCARAADVARPWLAGWLARPDGSHGSSALRLLGLTGARGEAAGGFPTARTVGLPAYRERLAMFGDAEDAARWTLLRLMAANNDTNLVARGGPEALAFVQGWAQKVVEQRPAPDALVATLAAIKPAFVARRLSPGGSADLLAVTWFLRESDRSATRRVSGVA